MWKRLSLGTKMLLCFVLVLLLPIGLMTGQSFYTMQQSVYQQSQTIFESGLRQFAEEISRKTGNVERVAQLFIENNGIRSVFGNRYANEKQRVIDYQVRNRGLVRSLVLLNDEINAVFLYNEDMILCEMTSSFVSVRDEDSPELFSSFNLPPLDSPAAWTFYREGLKNVLQPKFSPQTAISFRRGVLDHNGAAHVAMLEIVMEEDALFGSLYDYAGAENIRCFAVDSQGNILSGEGTGRSITEHGFTRYSPGEIINEISGDAIIIAVPVNNLGFSLVSIVPLSNIRGDYLKDVPWLVCGMALFLLLCCAIFFIITRALLRGVKPMLEAMDEIRGGNFSTRLPVTSRDELGVLAENFNFMSERLSEQVKHMYMLGQMEREAEFRVLEANMNPHFLYNSLATIAWIARAHGEGQIVEASQALGQYYRTILSKGKSIITLKEEIEMLNAYLVMQKIRFEDQIEIEIDISDGADTFPIIKNILQPLVENAIDHGIIPKRGKGIVRVCGFVKKGLLYLSVTDDGVGMSESKRAAIMGGNAPDEESGYAIRNIIRRLEMFYGDKHRFQLVSQKHEGTRVEMILPPADNVMNRSVPC